MTFATHNYLMQIIFFFALLAEKLIILYTRWQHIKMKKKHPAPPPQLTYNG
jgi:hypothetical protein